MSRLPAACVLLACSCWLSATLLAAGDTEKSAADWPQWRGPQRDGIAKEKGLLQKWTTKGPPLDWKADGLGEGYASLVIANGKIFTMGKRGNTVLVMARDGNDGHQIWATPVGGNTGDAPSSTPTVDDDLVFAVGPQGDIVCVDAAGGKLVWQKSFTKDFGGSVPTWKYCESPLVDGDKLICTPGGRDATLVALNKNTGDTIWKCAVPGGAGGGAGYASTVISEGTGVKQYIQLMGEGTGCIGVAEDGRFLWNYPRVSNGTACVPTPIVHGDYVFCSSGYSDGGSALLKLSRSGNGVKAEESYYLGSNVFQNHHGGLVLVGDYVYGGHGQNQGFPTCVELKTGKVKWGGKLRGPGQGSAAVVVADQQCYFRYEDGLMALIGANPKAYKLNGQFKIPQVAGADKSWSHPVVAGGKLYLREQDSLFVYKLSAKK